MLIIDFVFLVQPKRELNLNFAIFLRCRCCLNGKKIPMNIRHLFNDNDR